MSLSSPRTLFSILLTFAAVNFVTQFLFPSPRQPDRDPIKRQWHKIDLSQQEPMSEFERKLSKFTALDQPFQGEFADILHVRVSFTFRVSDSQNIN